MVQPTDLGALATQQSPLQVDDNPAPEAVAARETQWMSFFENPQVQAALLQFGVSALQPKAPGQSTAGAIGQAVGEGAEAATRVGKAEEAKALQATETQTAAEKLALQERGVVATERAGDISAKRFGLDEARLTQQAGQFQARLRQDLQIATDSAEDKLLLAAINAEIEAADIEFRAPNLESMIKTFEAFRKLKAGETDVAGTDFAGETPEQIATRLQGFTTPEERAAASKRALAAGVSQETIDAAFAINDRGTTTGQPTVKEAVTEEALTPKPREATGGAGDPLAAEADVETGAKFEANVRKLEKEIRAAFTRGVEPPTIGTFGRNDALAAMGRFLRNKKGKARTKAEEFLKATYGPDILEEVPNG